MMRKERGNRYLKYLDRLLGTSLLLLLGAIRGKRALPLEGVRRIALLKTAAIGDTVILSRVVKPLRRRFPHAELYLFTGTGNYGIGGVIEGVDSVAALSVTNPFRAIRTIRRAGKFDIIIDFGSWPRIDAIITAFSRSSCSIGFKTRDQYRHYAYDLAIEHRGDQHELYNYFDLLKPLGVKRGGDDLIGGTLKCGDSPMSLEAGRRHVIFHLFPGGTKSWLREWPVKNWLKLGRYFLGNGWTILISGGPDDLKRSEEVVEGLENHPRVLNICGKVKIEETRALLPEVDLIITVNTGIMHLADALNTTLIALNGPTNPKRWGPLGKSAVTITPEKVPCSPCLNLGFEYRGCRLNICMQSIKPELIVETVEKILAKKESDLNRGEESCGSPKTGGAIC